MFVLYDFQAQTEDGRQVLIPVQLLKSEPANQAAAAAAKTSQLQKPKRTGSLALFFRKVSSKWTTFIVRTIRHDHASKHFEGSNKTMSALGILSVKSRIYMEKIISSSKMSICLSNPNYWCCRSTTWRRCGYGTCVSGYGWTVSSGSRYGRVSSTSSCTTWTSSW